MWWLIATGALGSLAVLAIGARLSAGKHPPGRHEQAIVAEEIMADLLRPVGSMILAEERGLHGPGASTTLLPAPPPELAHEPDWREQTAADLAPEALDWPDSQVTTDGSAPGWLGADPFSCHPWPGSGPGAALSSLTAPSPDSGTAMVAGEIPARPLGGHETAVPPTRLADMGDIALVAGQPDKNASDRAGLVGHGTERELAIAHVATEPSRLADTGDIASAHLLADVQAFMRAQDDDARAYGSAGELGWHDFMQQYWAGFAEALA